MPYAYRMAAVLSLLCTQAAFAEPDAVIDEESFSYSPPGAWQILGESEEAGMRSFALFSEELDMVVRLAVFDDLDSGGLNAARQNLRKALGEDKPEMGLAVASHRTFDLAPFGEVDEEVSLSTTDDYKNVAYHVYGSHSIAILIFTLRKDVPDAVDAVRPLLLGLEWKAD